jgi:hypothetical protein
MRVRGADWAPRLRCRITLDWTAPGNGRKGQLGTSVALKDEAASRRLRSFKFESACLRFGLKVFDALRAQAREVDVIVTASPMPDTIDVIPKIVL